jgi:hypothetical protein
MNTQKIIILKNKIQYMSEFKESINKNANIKNKFEVHGFGLLFRYCIIDTNNHGVSHLACSVFKLVCPSLSRAFHSLLPAIYTSKFCFGIQESGIFSR